jgi:phosphatidylserine decarboxylase
LTVSTFAAAQILRFVPRVRLSRAVGRLCDQRRTPLLVDAATKIYSRAYDVDLSDVDPTQGPYASFDDFFTRRLKPGARTIASAGIVSPADGNLVAAGDVTDASIVVKGRPYDVVELCGWQRAAEVYRGGQYAVIYLHPRDYHRVHSPVDGMVTTIRSMPGDLFPVNAIGERHFSKLFVRNQRVSIVVESPDLGTVQVVMVGATIVGRITTVALGGSYTPLGEHRIEPTLPVSRGGEVGTFHLGSTVVLLLPGSAKLSHATGPVRYGESLERVT